MSDTKRNAVVIIALALITTVVLYMMATFKPKAPVKPATEARRIPITAIPAERVNYQVSLPSQGLIEPRTQSSLAVQVSGNVIATNANFETGGSFKAGDVLVTVDDADYKVALKVAEASVNQARVAMQEEQARGAQALRDWQRLGNGSEPSELVIRKPQLLAAEATLESAQAQLEKAALDLSRTRVVAPYDGRVIGNAIDVGNFVTQGQALGDIVEAGSLQVTLPLSAAWRHLLDWSGRQNSVQIHLPDSSDSSSWQATISRASADISAESRQFTVEAVIDLDSASTPSVALFIGDYVNANIAGKQLKNVMPLPRKAVYEDSYVWVVEDDTLQKRQVNVVWLDSTVAVIDTGLEVGELVATTALGSVFSGTQVRIIGAEPLLPEETGLDSSQLIPNGEQG